LSLKRSEFLQRIQKRNRQLKALLLDQTFIAGVGNIYADEALFVAGLRPDRRSGSLSLDECDALFRAVRKVICAGVRNGGTSLGKGQGNYVDLNGASGGHRERVKVYGRAGEPCMVCGTVLEKTIIAQRGTVYCPHCQH
jgi:formamidopyrimidine-DNA glycosylase